MLYGSKRGGDLNLGASLQAFFSIENGAEEPFNTIPAHMVGYKLPFYGPYWRIELYELLTGGGPLRLRVVNDAIIGCGRKGRVWPDIDLTWFGGWAGGVSRRHVILRPTRNHLYAVDMGSKNGTLLNGIRLMPGELQQFVHDDVLQLGALPFQVKIIEGPDAQ